jgi:hypothetical protein
MFLNGNESVFPLRRFPLSITNKTFTRFGSMSNTTGVLYESGTAYPSRPPVFTLAFVLLGSVLLIFLVSVLCFLLCMSSVCVWCLTLPASLFLIVHSLFSNVYSPKSLESPLKSLTQN